MLADHFLLRFFLFCVFGFLVFYPAGLLFARNKLPVNVWFVLGGAFGVALPLTLFVIDGIVVGMAVVSAVVGSLTAGLIGRWTSRIR